MWAVEEFVHKRCAWDGFSGGGVWEGRFDDPDYPVPKKPSGWTDYTTCFAIDPTVIKVRLHHLTPPPHSPTSPPSPHSTTPLLHYSLLTHVLACLPSFSPSHDPGLLHVACCSVLEMMLPPCLV